MNTETYLEKFPPLTRAVVGYLVTNDRVILGLRKKVSWGLGENLISGIGGKVGDEEAFKGESDEEALVRELREEVGVTLISYEKVGEITFLFPHKPKWSSSVAAYLITQWQGEPQETEPIKPESFFKSSLPTEQMWDDNQYWVPLILEGKKVRAVFEYGEDNKTVVNSTIDIVEKI